VPFVVAGKAMAVRGIFFDAATTEECFAAFCFVEKFVGGVSVDDIDALAGTAMRADEVVDCGGGWLVHGAS
jgi:hypothetical protein